MGACDGACDETRQWGMHWRVRAQEGRAFERATGRIVLVEVREGGAAVEQANGHIVRLLEPLVRVRVRARVRVGVRVRVKVEW